MRISHKVCLTVLAFLPLACGPAGPTRYMASGNVSWEGKPIAEGHIKFIPVGGKAQPASAEIFDGTYECQVEAGEMRVEILATREKQNLTPDELKQKTAMGMGPREQYIPADYSGPTSKLKATVTAGGPNQFDFRLPQ